MAANKDWGILCFRRASCGEVITDDITNTAHKAFLIELWSSPSVDPFHAISEKSPLYTAGSQVMCCFPDKHIDLCC